MCARLWHASRGLFVGLPPRWSRQLVRCLRLRLWRLRQHFKHLREHRHLEVQLRYLAAHRLKRLVQRLIVKVMVPQRFALEPGVRDEVLGQVMLRKCRPRQGTSSPGAACRGRARPTREEKQHKGTRRTRVAGLVKDMFADTPKTHCTRLYCASVTACLNCCAIPPVLEVRRLALVSRWSSARPWSVRRTRSPARPARPRH